MTSYIFRNQKKKERQERLESDLKRAIVKGDKLEKIMKIAEEVKQARIRTLKSNREQFYDPEKLKPFDDKIEIIKNIPLETILKEFKR